MPILQPVFPPFQNTFQPLYAIFGIWNTFQCVWFLSLCITSKLPCILGYPCVLPRAIKCQLRELAARFCLSWTNQSFNCMSSSYLHTLLRLSLTEQFILLSTICDSSGITLLVVVDSFCATHRSSRKYFLFVLPLSIWTTRCFFTADSVCPSLQLLPHCNTQKWIFVAHLLCFVYKIQEELVRWRKLLIQGYSNIKYLMHCEHLFSVFQILRGRVRLLRNQKISLFISPTTIDVFLSWCAFADLANINSYAFFISCSVLSVSPNTTISAFFLSRQLLLYWSSARSEQSSTGVSTIFFWVYLCFFIRAHIAI